MHLLSVYLRNNPPGMLGEQEKSLGRESQTLLLLFQLSAWVIKQVIDRSEVCSWNNSWMITTILYASSDSSHADKHTTWLHWPFKPDHQYLYTP